MQESDLDVRQYWFSRSEVAGTLAMWAIRQSPYLIPDGLNLAVRAIHDAMPDHGGGIFGMTEDDLREAIERICLTHPAIVAWNEPKSKHKAQVVFHSRYDQPAPDDDFIDLHALAGNICRSLLAAQDD